MSIELYISFVSASLLFGLMPGPSVCFTIAHAIRHGSRSTAPTILGQTAANGLQLLIIVFGLSNILEQSVVACTALRMAGSAYLVYLGVRTIRATEPQIDISQARSTRRPFRCFADGFIVCGTNPKALLYYAAFLPQFMNPEADAAVQLLILGVSSIFVAILVLAAYTAMADRARYWLIERGLWRTHARVSGGLIIAAGGTLALADTT